MLEMNFAFKCVRMHCALVTGKDPECEKTLHITIQWELKHDADVALPASLFFQPRPCWRVSNAGDLWLGFEGSPT